jgi:hypothetical protein
MSRLKRLGLVLIGACLVLMVGLALTGPRLTAPAAPKMTKADSSVSGDPSTWGEVNSQVEQTIREHHHWHHHRCHHHASQEQGSDGPQYESQSEPQYTPAPAQQPSTTQPEPTVTVTVQAPTTQAATVPVSTPAASATPSPTSSSGSLWLQPCTTPGQTTVSGGKTWTCTHSKKYNDTVWYD